ncbi:Hypothetical predicted protein [Cloeon dipterum]|uniref:Peptidase M13 C-terminal domain-containing protein n=1 Tax=Cloeon dipterum TaxID=197152 RepID=A0A8S1DGY2_9INSE|nr:Hypothetical predicted protein [Cloeon dipterum]
MQTEFSVESNDWKMRQHGSSRYIVFLVLLILMFSVTSTISETHAQVKTIQGTNQAICISDECFNLASRILTSMNESVDPCDDFYQFACGGYVNKHQNSETGSKSTIGDLVKLVDYRVKEIFNKGISPSMPETVKQAIDFYEKCIDEGTQNNSGLEPMFSLLESLGLPRLPIFRSKIQLLPEVLIRGDKMTGKTPFFNIAIEQQHGNTYLTWNVQKQVFNKQLFEEFFKTLDRHFRLNVIDAQQAARDLFDFYSSMFTFSVLDKNEVWMSVAEFQQLADDNGITWFNWKRFLTSFLEDSSFKFDLEKGKILVRGPTIAKQLFYKLHVAQNQRINSYTWFFYFYSTAPYTMTDFRDKYFAMDPHFRFNSSGEIDLQTRCIAQARSVFPDAISYAYISKYFDEETKQNTEVMVEDIYQAFKLLIRDIDWTDEQTKRFALEKLDAVKQNVGYPQWLMAPGALDGRNYCLEDVRGDWLTMNLKANIAASKKYFLYKFNDTNWTGTSKMAMNACYEGRQVYVPAEILNSPFTKNGLASLNYASLGVFIGHEFTRGFDDEDLTVEKNEEQKKWWSRKTLKNFDERVQCMVDQYSQFLIPELGSNFKLNSIQTISENIADIGGLREALLAYDLFKNRQMHNVNGTEALPDPEPYLPVLTSYSHKQLFFLGFSNMWCQKESPAHLSQKLSTDAHSLSHQRVLSTLANNRDFAEAWQCPLGSRMNPVKKCIDW